MSSNLTPTAKYLYVPYYMNCRFCDIIAQSAERIIRQTEHTFTILSDPKLMSGHLLVIPRRHVEKFSELTKEERGDVFEEMIRSQEKVLQRLAPGCDIAEHFRPFVPDNKFKVAHLHIHIRPRTLDDELYQKVQIYEREIFTDLKAGEWEEYKTLLKE